MEEDKFEDNMPFPWESEGQFSKRYNDAYSIVHNVSNYGIDPWDNPFYWQNNEKGIIVGNTFNDELRFVPERFCYLYEEYEQRGCPDLFKYTYYDPYSYCEVEDELCAADFPVVARGFVGYLLPRMSYFNFDSEIAYEEYFIKRWEIFLASQKRKPRHKRIPQSEYMNQFISEERNLINDSEDVYEYLTQIDIDNIKEYIADFMAYISDRLTANKMTACVEENKTDSENQNSLPPTNAPRLETAEEKPAETDAEQNNGAKHSSEEKSKDEEFRMLIPNDKDKNDIMNKLHNALDGKKGVIVVKVLKAANKLGWILDYPSYEIFVRTFDCRHNKSSYNTQIATNYSDKDLEPYITSLLKIE